MPLRSIVLQIDFAPKKPTTDLADQERFVGLAESVTLNTEKMG
jgi:hypothetical protein